LCGQFIIFLLGVDNRWFSHFFIRVLTLLLIDPSVLLLSFEFGRDLFEGFNSALIIGHKEVKLWQLSAQVVSLTNRFVDFKDIVELFIRLKISSVEGYIAFSTAGKHFDCFLIGHLETDTGMTEKVETRKLDGVLIDLQAD
jgi:hypothetical protein